MKIEGGTIKDVDKNEGAFADQDILKSVKRIEFEQPLKLEGDFQYWFEYVKDPQNEKNQRLTNLTEISGLDNIDTSKVTNMRGMFYASKITSLDLSTWDTSSVTDMGYMFTDMFSDGNDGLLNVGGKFAATSKNVKDMTYMFNGCADLSKIKGIENLNTSSVTSMENMFHGDYNLTELNLSHFNTENVINMQDMLSYLVSLDYLDLSSFDTTKTKNMTNMLANDVSVMIAIIEI
ncbi:BspA family leucine-rich repeat surface protein [uncultured Lactobacillus sp.]|uniref:BspA family leucine-rich repeat surface protein n=1 Tax=uncultured Lactobacillus sp. TaxID=153152 RepID=UPI0025D00722|nr:BspA family leucine-rich repeat surface protein [uncultured Lactobacillus sp.]